MSSKHSVITNGPGKWDFALAVFEPGKQIRFTISEGSEKFAAHSYDAIIGSVEPTNPKRTQFLIKGKLITAGGVVEFDGFYDISSRRGNFETEE